jgi:processive 1,2-diacylglycerol beta-glucosyltransferase
VRIVLAIGDVAGGHRSAARALEQAFATQFPHKHEVTTVDLFQHADPMPTSESSDESFQRVARSPTYRALSDAFWYAHNAPGLHALFRAYYLGKCANAHAEALRALSPDVVVSIHPYISMTCAHLKSQGAPWRSVHVVIDFAPLFRGWVDPTADLVISPAAATTDALVEAGVEPHRIVGPHFPLRISLREHFAEAPLESQGQPLVLLLAGALGASTVGQALERLLHRRDWHLVMVCGRDEKARETLAERYRSHSNVKVLGFVNNVQDYIRQASVVVAKPGTGTSMELEALGARAVLLPPLGPQEVGTIKHFERNPRFECLGSSTNQLEAAVERALLKAKATDSSAHDGAFQIVKAIDALAHSSSRRRE